MRKAFVVKGHKYFNVKSGKVTPFGFVGIKEMDKFLTLKQANKKADLANYIFLKAHEYCQKRKVLNG